MAVQTPKKSSSLPWPALMPLGHHAGKSAISLKKTVILVGSRHNAHLHLLSRHVSKAHALILNDGGRSYIRDLASREQIYINGVAQREAWLSEGDLLKIGSFTFKYKEGPAGAAQLEPPPDAVLNVEGADAPLAVAEKVMLIGRRATCDVSLIEASVSTAHAVMFHVEGKRYLRDLGSRTGTWVNGAKIHQVELSPGDSIKIGETEMHYELAEAHEHAIGPADEEGNGEIDELEHLVGTARIDMVSEMNQAEPLAPDLEADLRSMFGAGAENKPAKDDDLIELELAPEREVPPKPAAKAPPEPVASLKPVAKEAPRPQPKAAPVEEPIELEPEAEAPIELEPAAPAAEKDWDEIDLSADPDVSDVPSAADTRALGMEFDHEPAKPTLSSQVVDEPVEVAAEADEQVLLGQDLHVGGPAGAAEVAAANEEAPVAPVEEGAPAEVELDATWPADLAPVEEADSATVTPEVEGLGLRGWQKSTREEEEAEALPEVEERVAPVEERAAEEIVEEGAAVDERPAIEEEIAPAQVVEEAPIEESVVETSAAESERGAVDEAISVEAPAEILSAPMDVVQPAEEVAAAPVEDAPETAGSATEAAVEVAPVEEEAVSGAPAVEAPMPLVDSPGIDVPPMEEAAASAVIQTGKKKGGRKTKAEREAEAKAKAAETKAAKKKAAELKAAEAKAAKEKAAAEKAEAKRLAAEKLAAEKAEAKRIADEIAAAEAEAKRIAEEKAKAEEEAAAEARRIAEEKEAAEAETKRRAEEETAVQAKREAERVAAEAEARRVAEERAAAEAESRRVAEEKAAAEKAEAQRVAQARAAAEAEAKRIAQERADAEARRIAEEKAAAERLVAQRLAEEKAAEAKRIAQEQAAAEAKRLAEEKAAREAEAKRLAKEKAAAERKAAEEKARAEREAEIAAQPAAEEQMAALELESPAEPEAGEELEELEEVLDLDEEESAAPPAPAGASSAAVSPAEFSVERATREDDFFSDLEDTMPVLELDAAELEPSASHRDPDVLLALDQVDPEGLDEIEVIEPTEPTVDSALDLEVTADQETVAPQAGETSLTDSVFGKQIEEFAADSSGEIIEDLPEIEEVADADEELAIALGSEGIKEEEEPALDEENAGETPAPQLDESDDEGAGEGGFDSAVNITDGGIAPSAMGAVSGDALNWQEFGSGGEAVELDTPGDSQADAVLNGQAFSSDGGGQEMAAPAEEIEEQAFVSQGEAQPQPQPPRVTPEFNPYDSVSHTQPLPPSRGNAPAAPPRMAPVQPPPPPSAGPSGIGMGGGFVMGADLSSFIGGMPLVLPDLAPPPAGFGRAQVSFAGAKSSWDQAQRPSFPMGQSLAQEMMDAAEGLRDAEAMDDDVEVAQEEVDPDDEAFSDDGAPGDEWNVAGILDDDYVSPLEQWQPASSTPPPPVQVHSAEVPAELPAAEEALDEPAESAEQLSELDELQTVEEISSEESAEAIEAPVEELESELPELEGIDEPELEAIDELESEPEPALASDDAAELESAQSAEPDTEAIEVESPELESLDSELPELESAEDEREFEASDVEAAEPHLTDGEAPTAEADLPILAEADSSTTFSEDELLLELDAAPPADINEPPPAPSTTINENLGDDLSIEIEAIKFDEQAVEPPVAPPRVGAIEEGVAELEIEQAPQAGSLVDRTPPPPVAPAKPKAQAARIPPPPARTLRPRRGAAATPAAAEPPSADPVFGSLEHGSSAVAPFAGIPSVREVDVFSQASSTLDDSARALGSADASVFGGQMLAGGGNGAGNGDSHPPAAAPGARPRRVIVPPRMGAMGENTATPDYESREPLTRPAYRVVARRSPAKRILLVIFLMIVFMGLAALGILYYIHPRQTSSGELKYQGIESLTRLDRDRLRTAQFEKLTSPQVLLNARTYLAGLMVDPGFLSNANVLKNNLKAQWPDDRPAVMSVDYYGVDPEDKKRVFALLVGMQQDNAPVADHRKRLNADIAKLEKEIEEIRQMRAQRDEKKKIVDASPNDEEIQKLKDKVAEADQAYSKAVGELKDVQFEVNRIQEQLVPSPGNKTPAPGETKPGTSDAEMAKLQKSLTEATARIAALKASASEDADAKRKALDSAIEAFQQNAAGLMKENPQLAQYVQAVQQLQEKTHKLGGDLIEVQQQTHSQLSNLKKRLDDQMQARRTEIWAADKGLSDLRAQLDLAERGYNAGADVGLKPDSPEMKTAQAKIDDLKGKIDARKMTLGNDPMLTDVANDLQEMIKINQERLAAARERVEKDIKVQEQAFAQQNVVEKLPDTQRTQAAKLKTSQEHVNELRKQYALALDRRTAESNAALRELEGKVSDLNAQLEERKRVLAAKGSSDLSKPQEAQLRVLLEQKQLAMKRADEEATDTRKLFVARSRALQIAMDQRTESAGARVELETLGQGLADANETEGVKKLALDQKRDELKNLVTIEKPSESDVQVVAAGDDRWRYIAYSETGVAVVFVGILAMVSLSGGKQAAYEPAEEEEELPEAETGPLAIQEIGRRRTPRDAHSTVG